MAQKNLGHSTKRKKDIPVSTFLTEFVDTEKNG